MKYDVQKLNAYGKKIEYYGKIGEKEAFFKFNKGLGIFKPDTISGKIGDEEFNLTLKRNLLGNSEITGTYKNEPVKLNLKNGKGLSGGLVLEGKNTKCEITNQLFSNDLKSDGDFGYDKEILILPVVFTYINEAVIQRRNDDAVAMMM